MKRFYAIFAPAVLLSIVSSTIAQIDPDIDGKLERRSHTRGELTLPYRLFIPESYTTDSTYPLLLFLHGARWAGTDNVTQLDNELALYWLDSTRQAGSPCFLVYPQIPGGMSWEKTSGQVKNLPENPVMELLSDLLDSLEQEFSIDPSRLYVSGKSIGALGVYGIIARYPDRFSAAIPAAGYYVYQNPERLQQCSMWIFHNRDDNVAPVQQSRHVVEQLETLEETVVYTHCNPNTGVCAPLVSDSINHKIETGVRFMYSEFDDAGHQLENNVVATHGLYTWTTAQQRLFNTIDTGRRNGDPIPPTLCNFPNPFNQNTCFLFSLHQDDYVTIVLYNSRGQRVVTLFDAYCRQGTHSFTWHSCTLPSGVYFYTLFTRRRHSSRALVLQK